MRDLVVRLIQSIGSGATNAIPTLCHALSDKNPYLASNAAEALVTIGPVAASNAVAAIRPLINDTNIDPETRGNLIEVLQEFTFEAHHAIPELVYAINNDDDLVRSHCVIVIGAIGPPKADSTVPLLINTLESSNIEVQESVIEALVQFGSLAVSATPALLRIASEGNLDAIKVLETANPPHDLIIEPLLRLWRSGAEQGNGNSEIRSLFAKLDEIAVPGLIPELTSTNLLFCKQVLEVLGNIGPKAELAVESINSILKDPIKEDLHFKAAWELGRINSSVTGIYPVLISALQSGDIKERYSGVVALFKIRPIPVEGINALIDRLKNDSNPYVRTTAAMALERRDAHKALIIPALTDALNDLEPEVRKSSLNALTTYPETLIQALPKISSMLDDENDSVRVKAIEALGAIGPQARSQIQRLISIMMDREYAERREQELQESMVGTMSRFALPNPAREMMSKAAATLGLIGEDAQHVVPALIKAMADDETNLRSNAAIALGRFRERAQSSIPNLKNALNDENDGVRKSSAIALILVNPITPHSINNLVQMAKIDEGDGPQFRAVEALEIIGPEAKSAISALRMLQKTTQNRGIKMGIERALQRIE